MRGTGVALFLLVLWQPAYADDASTRVERICELVHEDDTGGHLWRADVDTVRGLGEPGREALLRLAAGPAGVSRQYAWRMLGGEFKDLRLLPILRSVMESRTGSAKDRGQAAFWRGSLNDASLLSGISRFFGQRRDLGRRCRRPRRFECRSRAGTAP